MITFAVSKKYNTNVVMDNEKKMSTIAKIEGLHQYISTIKDLVNVEGVLKEFCKSGLKGNEWVKDNSLRLANAFKTIDELIAELAKEIDATEVNIGSLENYIIGSDDDYYNE